MALKLPSVSQSLQKFLPKFTEKEKICNSHSAILIPEYGQSNATLTKFCENVAVFHTPWCSL